MQTRSYLIPLCLFLFSCHSGTPTVKLNRQNMYSPDTVGMVAGSGDDKEAAKKFYDGVAVIRKDTLRSIELFKASIFARPTPKAYYELAGALAGAHRYDEALQALVMAEQLGYTPLANVMFRYAYVYGKLDSLSDKSVNALHYMELAIQMGFAHPELFLNKNLFPGLARSRYFDAVYNDVLRGGPGLNNTEASLWSAFSGGFAPVSLPLTLDKKWIASHRGNDFIAWQYERFIPDMRRNKFARGDGKLYLNMALVKKTPTLTVLLYGTRDEEEEDSDMLSLHLATYNTRDGTMIDVSQVAGRESISEPFYTCTIGDDLKIKVLEFNTVYKQNPTDAGYDSSNIAGEKPGPPVYLQVYDDGKIR